MKKTICCVIPARLSSKRFPKKIIQLLSGKPLIQWVWEAAKQCKQFSHVSFAVDSTETAEVIEKFGGNWVLTNDSCSNGTQRIIDFRKKTGIEADVWVNWQADEPFISASTIQALLAATDHSQERVWTLYRAMASDEAVDDPNVVKVVMDHAGNALYFSRAAIPYMKKEAIAYQHIGIYAYSHCALNKIARMPPSCALEEAEGLEQLKFLYYGLPITVCETQERVIGINAPDDLRSAEEKLLVLR